MFYKTLGKAHLSFAQFEAVVMDIERHLNNRTLTYVESEGGADSQLNHVGTAITHLRRFRRRGRRTCEVSPTFSKARQHAWTLREEYIHGLMESHQINRNTTPSQEVREIVLIVADG